MALDLSKGIEQTWGKNSKFKNFKFNQSKFFCLSKSKIGVCLQEQYASGINKKIMFSGSEKQIIIECQNEENNECTILEI